MFCQCHLQQTRQLDVAIAISESYIRSLFLPVCTYFYHPNSTIGMCVHGTRNSKYKGSPWQHDTGSDFIKIGLTCSKDSLIIDFSYYISS